jgi:hypothetical protein
MDSVKTLLADKLLTGSVFPRILRSIGCFLRDIFLVSSLEFHVIPNLPLKDTSMLLHKIALEANLIGTGNVKGRFLIKRFLINFTLSINGGLKLRFLDLEAREGGSAHFWLGEKLNITEVREFSKHFLIGLCFNIIRLTLLDA